MVEKFSKQNKTKQKIHYISHLDIYHTTFDWPTDASIQQRLVTPNNYVEEDLVNRLITYNRHIGGKLNQLACRHKYPRSFFLLLL